MPPYYETDPGQQPDPTDPDIAIETPDVDPEGDEFELPQDEEIKISP